MFGEAESESPRVPSPWDSLISTPSTGTPSPSSRETSPPLDSQTHLPAFIPRLVPENDDGNVEYKLQLLNPSPARFARLVTQLKWRLLEGGGQAYYELGVADSGALVGLPRLQLEQSLETLEMMAGEIGASVIVVKEVEVPAYMADIAASETERERWKGSGRKKRGHGHAATNEIGTDNGTDSSTAAPSSWSTTTETETSTNTDLDDGAEEEDDLSTTVVFEKRPSPFNGNGPRTAHIDTADDIDDPANVADTEDDGPPNKFQYPVMTVDLEIATVFKPRPMRARMVHPPVNGPNAPSGGKQKRMKKIKHLVATHPSANVGEHHGHVGKFDLDPKRGVLEHRNGHIHNSATHPHHSKAQNRRTARDRRRDEKRRALAAVAESATTINETSGNVVNQDPETAHLVDDLSNLHVSVNTGPAQAHAVVHIQETEDNLMHVSTSDTFTVSTTVSSHISESAVEGSPDDDDDDDVFASLTTAKPPFASFSNGVKKLSGDGTSTPNGEDGGVNDGEKAGNRLIVEALVVRKMSLDEGFLDFGGFTMI